MTATPATWHPQALRDATLTGLPATCVIAVDPGRPTGLAILVQHDCSVWAATGTVKMPAGCADRQALHAALEWDQALWGIPCQNYPFGSLGRGVPAVYAAELGQVFARRGQDPTEAAGRNKSVASVARLEGQLQATLDEEWHFEEQHLYLAQEWRAGVLGAGARRMAGPLAKLTAVDFVRRHFGAEGKLPDHEAEALCVGLHCLRELAREHRGEQQLALGLACPESAPKQARGRRSAARR